MNMKKIIFLICASFFVLTGFNQQERFVEQSNAEFLGRVSTVYEKPKIKQRLMSLTVNEGGIAPFIVIFVPDHDPNLKVEWYRNDKPIPSSDRIKPFHEFGYASLTINKVTTEDAGEYKVKIRNNLGEVESKATLKVTK